MLLFRRFRFAIPVGLVAALLALVFMGTASTPPGIVVDPSEIQEDTIREMYDSSGRFIDPDDKMSSAASSNPGGFGGFYFDPNDPSTVYVYMKDTSRTAAAETALRAALHDDSQYTNIVPVNGKYSMDELVAWHRALLQSLDDTDIEVGATWMSPEDNAFRVDIANESDVDTAWGLVDGLNIPRDAVLLEVGGEWETLAYDDKSHLDAKWRPVVGGVRHTSAIACTIGAVTERDGVAGVIIASHCTRSDRRIGGLDGAEVHQPGETNKIGDEDIDPDTKHIDHPHCMNNGTNCRLSDAAFSEMDSGVSIDRGEIAKPQRQGGTLVVSPVGTTWDVTSEEYPTHGRTIYYSGQTSGWRVARVHSTCGRVPTGQAQLVCMGIATTTSANRPRGGDSGAPVFEFDGGDIELLGFISQEMATSLGSRK